MEAPLIIIEGPEQGQLQAELPDGGLPPLPGVESYQVFRASKAAAELTDGRGWTYHHHVDMACWRGLLYVAWNSCERDEDVWPSRELFSTSTDGRAWSPPRELFPQGVSTPLRMYFFHAGNDHMLAIAGQRLDTRDSDEDRKWPVVVREIREDHTLGEVFVLQGSSSAALPMFGDSNDAGFIAACRELLADNVFLEQQDRGKLLGPRRMKWHDPSAWPAGAVPGDSEKWVAGKAYSFFRRRDDAIIGISKMGWTTISRDNGQSWAQPRVPPTLVTGKAKVWAQRTPDGRYALVYNPSRGNRFPLVIVTSDDGIHFRDMRIVQGELPIQRYRGLHRSIGPQYVRGISPWSSDRSRGNENAIWLVYSMNKEDIWVSRVAFSQPQSGWHLYCPKWASISIVGDELRLENRDPRDDAAATMIFPPSNAAAISFEFLADQPNDPLYVAVAGAEPFHLTCCAAGKWQAQRVEVRAPTRITFRTGPPRGIGGAHPVPPQSDRPRDPSAFRVRNLHTMP